MRRFNPEKELKKIQHGNKNKIIIFVFLLLIVGVIGYSFALYQVRYSKRIIYTKVAPFSNKDIILSVKLDDQEKSTDKFPTKEEGYAYSHIECENNNITNASWNITDWNLTASIKGPDKCTVFFAKNPFNMKTCENKTMADCLLDVEKSFPNFLGYNDPDQNARYIGANPPNYVWFNCDDYDHPSAETCERWAIIGSFKNIKKIKEDKTTEPQNLVKIMRSTMLEKSGFYLVYDNKNTSTGASSDVGSGDWSNAHIMKLLNPGYESEKIGGSLYYNGKGDATTLCYGATSQGTALNNATVACDFSETGLKNQTTRNHIENVIWNLGKLALDSPVQSSYNLYLSERSNNTTVNNTYSTVWPTNDQINKGLQGKVGLIYVSDYGYATSGGSLGMSTCVTSDLTDYGRNNLECGDNDWIHTRLKTYVRTMTEIAWSQGDQAYSVYGNGIISSNGAAMTTLRTYPVLFLKHDTKVISGDGTYENPYLIKL